MNANTAAHPSFGYTDPQSDAMSTVLAQNWWAVALRGIFGILFGLIALLVPVSTILGLTLFFAAYMLVDGIFGIVAGIRAAQRHERWGMLVAEAIVNFIAGGIALLLPGLTVVAFVLLLAAWAVVSGGLMIGAAFRLNIEHGRWWLVLSGVCSVIFGALLFIAPLLGAIVLTWWVGAYAIVFGVMLLMLAFRLRAHRDDRAPSPAPPSP
jgi:uncharacterized membrane protein HdeD (DUF308 family)